MQAPKPHEYASMQGDELRKSYRTDESLINGI